MIKDLAKLMTVYITGAITLLVGAVLVIAVPTIVSRFTRPKVHEVTSPLDTSVVRDLCQKLDLPVDEPICQTGSVVYAPALFPAVRAQFKAGETTYDDVQDRLGSYQYQKGPTVTQANGTAYFWCRYDFKGDRVFPVVFSFSEDGVMERLFPATGDDWP